jgi:hypothetical protein
VAADVKDDHFHYECTELPTKLAPAGTPFLEALKPGTFELAFP